MLYEVITHIGERGVQKTVFLFRTGDLLVETDRFVSRDLPDKRQKPAFRFAEFRDQNIGDDQRAGIDERIARNSFFIFELDDRIKRRTRRFDIDPFPEIFAEQTKRLRQRENIGNA